MMRVVLPGIQLQTGFDKPYGIGGCDSSETWEKKGANLYGHSTIGDMTLINTRRHSAILAVLVTMLDDGVLYFWEAI